MPPALTHISRAISLAVLLAGTPHTSQELAQPKFRVQTDAVIVPFEVRRGSHPVSDLNRSDVVLLEDGVPRGFSGFEAPADHPSLDLVVMFDVTEVQRGGFLSGTALQHMVSYWNDTIMQALLQTPGATIRISVYQFHDARVRRLCRPTSDPQELFRALNRLTDPIPAGQGFELTLPEGVVVRKNAEPHVSFLSMSLLGAIRVLEDVTVGATRASRALVIFSSGAEATSMTPQDLADQGIASSVPIYPVVLPATQWISYDPDGPLSEMSQLFQSGLCPGPAPERRLDECPLNTPFASVGKQTGGRSFEAARQAVQLQTPRDIGAYPPLLDRFSMTGRQANDILETVKRHALARFTASYTLWFTPSPSASSRTHKLEVKLAVKSDRKITDGKRNATY